MKGELLQLARFRFTTTFRSRRRDYLAIVLLLGLVGGLAMGAVAGARRTQSVFTDFSATANTSDYQIQPYIGQDASVADGLYRPSLTRDLGQLAHVQRVAGYVQMFIAPLNAKGNPYLPFALQNNEVITIGPINGEFSTQDRVIADKGRLANPKRIGEFMATEQTARILHWHLGETFHFGIFTLNQIFQAQLGLPKTPYYRFTDRLVGIVALGGSVVHDEVDSFPGVAIFSAALTNKAIGAGAAGYPVYDLRLDQGSSDVGAVQKEVVGALPPNTAYAIHITSIAEAQVERATKPDSLALGTFGVIAGLVALTITMLILVRSIGERSSELDVLRALGAPFNAVATDLLLGNLGAIIVGALLASLLGVALSPLSPVGTVREIDPSPGFAVDWTVIAVGLVLFIVVLGSLAVSLGARAARRQRVRRTTNVSATSYIVRGAMRLGAPISGLMGIRFAVEKGRGNSAAPVGSAMVGATLAVLVVVTTITFGSGLSTLVSHPNLYGWNWSYAINEVGAASTVPPLTEKLLNHDADVSAWAGFNFLQVEADNQPVPVLLTSAHAELSPPILSGHTVEGTHQVVLGAATLAQLHRHVGQTIVVTYGSPNNAPFYIPPITLTIVGTATFPAIGEAGKLHVSMGVGALALNSIEPAAMVNAGASSDPNQNGPSFVAIRLRNGTNSSAGLASLRRITRATSHLIENDHSTGGGAFQLLSVQQPAEIVNYRLSGSTPFALASALAVGALFALALTLIASVGRRRRDLALLKALGFTKRQLALALVWQSTVAVVVGLFVGIPLGVIAGRWLWDLFARQIYAVPDATVPGSSIALVVLAALSLAVLVSILPGRLAARTSPALVLRGE